MRYSEGQLWGYTFSWRILTRGISISCNTVHMCKAYFNIDVPTAYPCTQLLMDRRMSNTIRDIAQLRIVTVSHRST